MLLTALWRRAILCEIDVATILASYLPLVDLVDPMASNLLMTSEILLDQEMRY